MRKVLFLIAQKDFQDKEFSDTKKVLVAGGFSVCVAAENDKMAVGSYGTRIMPDYSFSGAFRRVSEFYATVVIGGPGCVTLMNNSFAMRILKLAYDKGQVVAAICWAPRVLASAGLLKGRRATVNTTPGSDVYKEMQAAGAVVSDGGVVIDGRIITGFGPTFAMDFGKAILKKLNE